MYNENIMKFAHILAANHSQDESAKICCIITCDDKILSIGFNTLVNKKGDLGLSLIKNKTVKKHAYIHAEINAFNKLKYNGEVLDVYITRPPCLQCGVSMFIHNDYKIRNIFHVDKGSDTFNARYNILESNELCSNFTNVNKIKDLDYDGSYLYVSDGDDISNFKNLISDAPTNDLKIKYVVHTNDLHNNGLNYIKNQYDIKEFIKIQKIGLWD